MGMSSFRSVAVRLRDVVVDVVCRACPVTRITVRVGVGVVPRPLPVAPTPSATNSRRSPNRPDRAARARAVVDGQRQTLTQVEYATPGQAEGFTGGSDQGEPARAPAYPVTIPA